MTINYMDIVLADLPKMQGHVQSGVRPVLVVSNSTANSKSSVITVIPLTTQFKRLDLETHVVINSGDLKKPSVALVEQLMVLDRSCVIKKIGSLKDVKICTKIKEAIVSHMLLAA